jgi:hypothetical protein
LHSELFSQDCVGAAACSRAADFAEEGIRSIDNAIELLSLGISLPVPEIYRNTGLALRSHRRLTARRAVPAQVNSCLRDEAKAKTASVGLRCGRFVAIDGRESMS